MRSTLALGTASLLLASCTTVGWQGEVNIWGSMHAVMREGQTQGRVRVVEAAGDDVVGIGALAGLEGEISIVDGAVWISRAGRSRELETTQGAAGDAQAALLVTASIHEWVEIPIQHELPLASLPAFAGFTAQEWLMAPFVVKGRLMGLDAHVLCGACPYATPVPAGKEPVRRYSTGEFGTLVGFWTRERGTITHAGEELHVHAIVNDAEPWTGHVDSVRIGAGSVLRVPRAPESVLMSPGGWPTR